MLKSCGVFIISLHIYLSQASLLLWSSEKLEIPVLKTFTNEDLENLLKQLNHPKIVAYKGITANKFYNLEKVFNVKYSAYVPNEDVILENVTSVNDFNDDQLTEIHETETVAAENSPQNVLVIFVDSDRKHHKREAPDSTTAPTTDTPAYSGPVLYKATDNKTGAMVYSSQLLLLRINATTKSLGKSFRTTISTKKNNYVKLSVNLKDDDGKLLLYFYFPYTASGYWTLENVEIEFANASKVTLKTKAEILAPRGFSYHCTGFTNFSDVNGTVELTLYDLQTQIGETTESFGDAYDCVPFTTAPIWSGLFVTFILGIGLTIALNAIGNIKTMDRYENKSKQLTVTVFE